MILALGVRNSLAPCVSSPRVFLSITLRTPHQNNTKGKRAQKRKQPNTHVPRPDPARNHPSRPRPRQTPSHPSQTQTTPTQHTPPQPPTTKHTNTKTKPKTQNGDKGESRRGEGKKRGEEKGRRGGERRGEKHKTGTRGNRTPDLLHSPRGVRRSRTLPRDPQRIFCERAVGAFPGKPIDDQFAGPVLTSECSGT